MIISSITGVFKIDRDLQRASKGEDVELIWELNRGEYNVHLPFRFKFQLYNKEDGFTLFQYDIGAEGMTAVAPKYQKRISISIRLDITI